jgi:hypothetical protein
MMERSGKPSLSWMSTSEEECRHTACAVTTSLTVLIETSRTSPEYTSPGHDLADYRLSWRRYLEER